MICDFTSATDSGSVARASACVCACACACACVCVCVCACECVRANERLIRFGKIVTEPSYVKIQNKQDNYLGVFQLTVREN